MKKTEEINFVITVRFIARTRAAGEQRPKTIPNRFNHTQLIVKPALGSLYWCLSNGITYMCYLPKLHLMRDVRLTFFVFTL